MSRLLLIVLLAPLVAANEYVRQPYTNDSFSKSAKFGDNVTLDCGDLQGNTVEYWILPDASVIYRDGSKNFDTIDGPSSWVVSGDGTQMHVSNVREPHFGLYHCVSTGAGSQSKRVVKRGVNYQGPYFGDLWEVYRRNTMIGGIAAASFLVVVVVLFVIYRMRHRDRETEGEYEQPATLGKPTDIEAPAAPDTTQAYTNLAYDSKEPVGANGNTSDLNSRL